MFIFLGFYQSDSDNFLQLNFESAMNKTSLQVVQDGYEDVLIEKHPLLELSSKLFQQSSIDIYRSFMIFQEGFKGIDFQRSKSNCYLLRILPNFRSTSPTLSLFSVECFDEIYSSISEVRTSSGKEDASDAKPSTALKYTQESSSLRFSYK